MTSKQFAALTKLLRLRAGKTQIAVRLHFVDGLSISDSARDAGADYQLVLKASYRVKIGLSLAKLAVGKN